MQEARRAPARRHPYKGKKPISTTAVPRNALPPTPFPRVATPPLSEHIPQDTPRFADLGKENLLHPTLIQTLCDDLKFDHMMPVQAETLHKLLAQRIDVLAQAKTGTGKTVAFLLPAIQTMINKNRGNKHGISLLVLTPTRELAQQIEKEAGKLLHRLPQYKVCLAIGGTNKNTEGAKISRGCDILIATPGRLFDHLSDENFKYQFRNLDTLVLDEADRLLDMGFMPQLKQIIACLPNKEVSKRQGMLFSATIAPHVEKVAHLVLSKGYEFISTIPKGEINTHERVPQNLIIVPTFSNVAAALLGALRAEINMNGQETFKTIVFAPTAALVDFYGDILSSVPGLPTISILHSRLSQSKRTSTTNAFREAKSGILVATDVVARGMDFPLVTNVFQVGVPADKESYVHRLGRTARAGAEGRGTFIIAADEEFFPKYTLKDINFAPIEADLSSQPEVQVAAERLPEDSKKKVYQAWLGYYKNVRGLKWDNEHLVRVANTFARDGLCSPDIPGLGKMLVGKMGLKGTKGLNVVPDPPRVGRNGGGGGGEGRSKGAGGKGKVLAAGGGGRW